jgi:hypothetical protein
MLVSKNFVASVTRCLVLAMLVLVSSGFAQKKLTFTTSSPEAKENFVQAIRALESFDFQKFTPLARKLSRWIPISRWATWRLRQRCRRQRKTYRQVYGPGRECFKASSFIYRYGAFYKNEDDKALESFKQLSQMLRKIAWCT